MFNLSFMTNNKSISKRILVYRYGQLGDTIVALPAFWAVRKYFPMAHITLLRDEQMGKQYVVPEMILPEEGLFDRYLHYPANIGFTKFNMFLFLLIMLRKYKFDTLIYLAPSDRSRMKIIRDYIFFSMIGINKFIGFRGRETLHPKTLSPNDIHESDYLLDCLASSGILVPPHSKSSINIGLTKQELEEADEWLEAYFLADKTKLLIGFAPGSKMPSKIWPEECYVAVGHELIAKLGVIPIIFGGSEDEALGDRLIAQWGLGINAAGKLSVRKAAAVFSRCKLYIGNDTGTMHLAAAVNTPCVAIFSRRDMRRRWYPYGQNHVVLCGTAPCEGCKLYVCNNNLKCLKNVSVDSVIQSCLDILCRK
ncbi:MAG: glycosyltransferase family 9 protein [Candidatus Omnitrophica bacterium]|nr:glycosyltransferase family 9 protein [Candidatus Omnitrophota bacterium]